MPGSGDQQDSRSMNSLPTVADEPPGIFRGRSGSDFGLLVTGFGRMRWPDHHARTHLPECVRMSHQPFLWRGRNWDGKKRSPMSSAAWPIHSRRDLDGPDAFQRLGKSLSVGPITLGGDRTAPALADIVGRQSSARSPTAQSARVGAALPSQTSCPSRSLRAVGVRGW